MSPQVKFLLKRAEATSSTELRFSRSQIAERYIFYRCVHNTTLLRNTFADQSGNTPHALKSSCGSAWRGYNLKLNKYHRGSWFPRCSSMSNRLIHPIRFAAI